MVDEVKQRASNQSTRSDSGYDSRGIGKVLPSDNKQAIAYELKGSTWHRGGTYGGGVSNFQGINIYDGEIGLAVSPYGCYRAKYYHEWDVEDILSFMHVEGRKYEIQIGNAYYRKTYSVDFQQRRADMTEEKWLKPMNYSDAESSDW